jgi:GNAT superfamily N-acetyltransferase
MNPLEDRPAISVQLAGIDEAATVAALLREAFAEFEPLYTAGAFAATTPTAEQLRARWAEGPVWIARLADEALGTVAAVPEDQKLYTRSMAVVPTARGRGVGRLLLEEVEGFARQCGCTRLFLSTTPFLHRAIRLYKRFGFVRTSSGPEELQGTPLFTMEKILDAEVVAE